MLKGLPDRPLSYAELDTLNESDSIGLVFPATPHSIQDDEQNNPRVCDLLMTIGDTVTALVYDESDGWTVVGRRGIDNQKEAVVNDVIEYRGYDIEDEEKVLQFVTELYGAMDELSQEE